MKVFKKFLAFLIVGAISFGGGFYTANCYREHKGESVKHDGDKFDLKLPGEVEKRVVTKDEIKSKLLEIAELSTYSEQYTVTHEEEESRHILDDIKVPGTTNVIHITASGVVKIGYDVKMINANVDEEKIYISLPEPQLNDNYVIWDTVVCDESNSILNPIEFSQYQELIKSIEEKGLKDAEEHEIYKHAEENLKEIINAFLAVFDGYEIVYM